MVFMNYMRFRENETSFKAGRRELKYLYQWESDEELIFVWTSFRIFEILKVTCFSFGFSLASSLKKRTESITLFSRVTCFYIRFFPYEVQVIVYLLPILIGFLCWFCLLWFARLPPWYCYTKLKPFSWCSLLRGKFGIKVLVQCESQ